MQLLERMVPLCLRTVSLRDGLPSLMTPSGQQQSMQSLLTTVRPSQTAVVLAAAVAVCVWRLSLWQWAGPLCSLWQR